MNLGLVDYGNWQARRVAPLERSWSYHHTWAAKVQWTLRVVRAVLQQQTKTTYGHHSRLRTHGPFNGPYFNFATRSAVEAARVDDLYNCCFQELLILRGLMSWCLHEPIGNRVAVYRFWVRKFPKKWRTELIHWCLYCLRYRVYHLVLYREFQKNSGPEKNRYFFRWYRYCSVPI